MTRTFRLRQEFPDVFYRVVTSRVNSEASFVMFLRRILSLTWSSRVRCDFIDVSDIRDFCVLEFRGLFLSVTQE